MSDQQIAGQRALVVGNDEIEVAIATDVGPRIIALRRPGGRNLFAELPGVRIDEGPGFTFYGGHRLWVAPELPEVTYQPDDAPPRLTSGSGTVTATESAPDAFERTISIKVVAGKPEVEVTHTVVNTGTSPRLAVPWAITQLIPGGKAVIPLTVHPLDPHRLQPNVRVVAWPYTNLAEVSFSQSVMVVDGTRSSPIKVGTSLDRGWMAYVVGRDVFVKRIDGVQPDDRTHADMGANGQCYCNDQFLELETLGPVSDLAPGESVVHFERWELHALDAPVPPELIAEALGLDGAA